MTTDKLTIDTPEQVHLEFTLADIGSRFLAVLIDMLIQFVLGIVFLVLCMMLLSFSTAFQIQRFTWTAAFWILGSFLILWGYYTGFEAFWKGQTPGKRVAGIRVIKESGRPINAFEAIARNLVRFVDYLPGFYGIGVLTMLLNQKRRRLGDMVAGTLVVHESSRREAELFFNTPAASDVAFHQAASLTPQEVELVEAFLSRRLDIPPAIRRQSAARIADMIATRLAIAPDARPADNENFLELIVREFRSRARYR